VDRFNYTPLTGAVQGNHAEVISTPVSRSIREKGQGRLGAYSDEKNANRIIGVRGRQRMGKSHALATYV
jgi:hypothetical protein